MATNASTAPGRAALDSNCKAMLAERLRAFYQAARQAELPARLTSLLAEFERLTTGETGTANNAAKAADAAHPPGAAGATEGAPAGARDAGDAAGSADTDDSTPLPETKETRGKP